MEVKSDFFAGMSLLFPLFSKFWLGLGHNLERNWCVPEGKPHE
jgi:hypothetical protein